MVNGIIGKKIGMTRIFADDGAVVPVTAILAGPCRVIQVKNEKNDGYNAVQLGFGEVQRLSKPEKGHLKDLGTFKYLREFTMPDVSEIEPGQMVTVDMFQPGEKVDVVGTSKGRGFAGVVKRHGFAGGPKTHGQKDRHRAPGSVGGGTDPGKTFKGQRMAGHMGNERVTVKRIEVVRTNLDRNILLVKGGVPGARNGLLLIRRANDAGEKK